MTVFSLPSPVVRTLNMLNRSGYEAYAVGGCVRDILLGTVPQDWDIATSATPTQVMQVFATERVIPTGIQHGTVTVVLDGMPLEMTTYRIDGTYSDGRHPDSVRYSTSIIDDLSRRDFTVNSMAYSPPCGLLDPFDGQGDLRTKTIRCVGEPTARFREDALRILRALRFSAVLDFSVEEHTATAIRLLAASLSRVAVERLTVELKRLLCGRACGKVFTQFANVLHPYIPCDDAARLSEVLTALPNEFPLRFAAALSIAAHCDASGYVQLLRLDTTTQQTVFTLLQMPPISAISVDADILHLLNRYGVNCCRLYFVLQKALQPTIKDRIEAVEARMSDLLKNNACYSLQQLDVTGHDLMAAGIPMGKAVGEALRWLLEQVIIEQCVNERTALLEALRYYQ